MKNGIRHIFIVISMVSILFFASCGVKEELVPAMESKTVNQLVEEKPMNFNFKIEAGQVDEFGRGFGKLFILGPLLKKFARFFANLSIQGSDGKEIELDTEIIDLSQLKDTETKYLEFIHLDKVELRIKDPSKKDTLKFFKKVEIYLENAEAYDLPTDDQGRFLLVSYDQELNGLKCNGTCLELSLAQLNWKTILFTKKTNQIQLKPKFVINSVPTQSFQLAGEVEFSIKFNPGF